MIYTVTVNPCLDVLRYLESKDASLGTQTIRPRNPNTDEIMRPGGKGLDVSRALTCLRVQSKALGFIGDQTGKIVEGLLLAEGIDSQFVETGIETRTNIILLLREKPNVAPHGEIRINSKGREVPPNKYHFLYDLCKNVSDPEAFIICGSLCHRMQSTFYNSLIRNAKKNNPNCVVILDGPPKATAEAMTLPLHKPDFIKPNLIEFENLIKVLWKKKSLFGENEADRLPPNISKEDFLEYKYTGTPLKMIGKEDIPNDFQLDKKKLTKNWAMLLGFVYEVKDEFDVNVILSLGPMGCVSINDQKQIIHTYYTGKVDVKTRVGAGDCLVAGFVSQYLNQRIIKDALRSAVAASIARIEVDESPSVDDDDSILDKYLSPYRYHEILEKGGLKTDCYDSSSDYKKLCFTQKVSKKNCIFGIPDNENPGSSHVPAEKKVPEG